MEIILFVQKMTSGFFDYFFIFFTTFGEELFIAIIIAGLYWLVSKDYAFKFALLYIISAGINQIFKSIVKRPRPQGVRKLFGTSATSYSFPSGHSQAVACYVGCFTNSFFKRKPLYIILGSVLLFLVMLSRIYLGHHFLSDVLAGTMIGYLIGYFGSKLFKSVNINILWYLVLVIPCFIVPFFTDKSLIVLACGGGSALIIGHIIENKFILSAEKPHNKIHFVIRVIVGYGVLTGLYFLLALMGDSAVASFVTFFILALWITCGAPFVFKLIERSFQGKEQSL